MSQIQAKQVVSYVLLPGFIPRARRLFASGFGYIAFLLASIYGAIRLLPARHPYLNPANRGKFGIRHVVAEAANNLVVSRKNIDQLIIFITTLSGMVLLVLQFVLLIYGFLLSPSHAAATGPPTPTALSIFETEHTTYDIAHILMDRVFGIPDMFGSCVDRGVECAADSATIATATSDPYTAVLPFPFHEALHALFQFYSTGLLLVGAIIFLYFLVVVVLETATTGTPFGERFQNIWVPVRLVLALGLLIPIHYGLNSGQYIALYAAKFGSGFATNGWIQFNTAISNATVFSGGGSNPTGEPASLLATPQAPDITPLVQQMSIVHACAYADWKVSNYKDGDDIKYYKLPIPPQADSNVKAYLVKAPMAAPGADPAEAMLLTNGTTYQQAMTFFDNSSDIVIRFGRESSESEALGNIEPVCGDIAVKINDMSESGRNATYGSGMVQEFYFDQIQTMWFEDEKLKYLSWRLAELQAPGVPLQCTIGCNVTELPACPAAGLLTPGGPPSLEDMVNAGTLGSYNYMLTAFSVAPMPLPPFFTLIPTYNPCINQQPNAALRQTIIDHYNGELKAAIEIAVDEFNNNGTAEYELSDDILRRGWGGAGIWYNTIARLNGAFVTVVMDVPEPISYPQIMEAVRENNRQNNRSLSGADAFKPYVAQSGEGGDESVPAGEFGANADAVSMANQLHSILEYWTADGANQAETSSENVFEMIINMIFGTEGLFDMRDKNAHIHPLAQLSVLGKGIVESTIRNIFLSSAAAFMGGFMAVIDAKTAAGAQIFSQLAMSTAFIGLTAGFVLYYILPFLPFLYFFFAVGQWVKSIFEAMVGVPLWALAHLRIDGEGLPGDSASDGYFLILDIFLRPILTVLGLVAAILIFSAQVRLLNLIWDLVVDNLSGVEGDATLGTGDTLRRSTIDHLFFTVTYAIVVYMMATASFKLIDKIPDSILRWAGSGVSTFGDMNQDPTQGLVQYAAFGGMTVGQQITGGIQEFSTKTGRNLGQALEGMVPGSGQGGPRPPPREPPQGGPL